MTTPDNGPSSTLDAVVLLRLADRPAYPCPVAACRGPSWEIMVE